MSEENILKSYLMSIGFKIDEVGYKKFKNLEEESDKHIKELGERLEKFATIAASSAGVLTASVLRISDRLTQLYYSSQLAGTSARNLQAFKSAAEQVGVSAEVAQQSVQALSMALYQNPQLGALLRGFNINPDQDKVQVLMELLDKLSAMPAWQATQIANMFGLDPQTFRMLEMHRDELHKFVAQYQELNKETDKQSEASRRFNQHLKDLENRFNKLWETISTRLLPIGEEVITWLDDVIDGLQAADKATDGWSSKILGVVSALGSVVGGMAFFKSVLGMLGIGGAAEATAGAGAAAAIGSAATATSILAAIPAEIASGYYLKKAYDYYNATGADRENIHKRRLQLLKEQGRLAPEDLPEYNRLFGGGGGGSGVVQDTIDKFAAKYGVSTALMHALAHEEHGVDKQGRSRISPKGAIGMFQLMPKTAEMLKVDPFNMEANIEGGIHYFADLLKHFGGNEILALAAYNAGEGKVDQYGGIPPFKETQNYVSDILKYRLAHPYGVEGAGPKVVISQETKIDINGVDDPMQAGRQVAAEQERVNGDLVRNASGVVK